MTTASEDEIPALERVFPTKVELKHSQDKKQPAIDLSLYKALPIVLCAIVWNMNLIRTDRHGSPLLVLLSKRSGRYIVAIHRSLLETHLNSLLSRYGFKDAGQWVESIDSRVLSRGRQSVDSDQLDDLRLLWAAPAKTSMKRFTKSIVFVEGPDLEEMISKVTNTLLCRQLQALWLEVMTPEERLDANCLANLSHQGNMTVKLDGAMRNRLSFLVTREESRQLLDKGFTGLGKMMQSKTLKSVVPSIGLLPWSHQPLAGGWKCLGRDWPVWWEAILCYHHGLSPSRSLPEHFLNRSWWKDSHKRKRRHQNQQQQQQQQDENTNKNKKKKKKEKGGEVVIPKQEEMTGTALFKRIRLQREEPIIID